MAVVTFYVRGMRVPGAVARRRLGFEVVGSLVVADSAAADLCLNARAIDLVCRNGSANQVVDVLKQVFLSIISVCLTNLADFNRLTQGVWIFDFRDGALLNSASGWVLERIGLPVVVLLSERVELITSRCGCAHAVCFISHQPAKLVDAELDILRSHRH